MTGNWGRWGDEDEAGALNLADPAAVRHAASLVRTGTVVPLAQPLGPGTPASPRRRGVARFLDRDAGDYALRPPDPERFCHAEDTVLLPTHSGTHLDALAHCWRGDALFNGHAAAGTDSGHGARRCGAEELVPVVTRGVLLDLVPPGAPSLEPGTAVGAAQLEDAYAAAGVEPRPGDAVLLRTGWWERCGGRAEEYFAGKPGIDVGAAAWLAARDVCLVGSDNFAVEVLPVPDGGSAPVHLLLLHEHGVPLLENLDLAALAGHGARVFLFVAAALPLVGSLGSPVTPVAVL